MNRTEFLKLTAAIVSGLALPSGTGQTGASAYQPTGQPVDLRKRHEYYLVKGLTGMARADVWFDAHWGAAVLAGHFLCVENRLAEETTAAIYQQLDLLISRRPEQFAEWPVEMSEPALIAELTRASLPALEGGLRAHGHAAIYASLAVQALRDVPQLSGPNLVAALCSLSKQIARSTPTRPTDKRSYDNNQTMIKATFDSLARFQPLLGRPEVRRPNFTHMVTHTAALVSLHDLGYRDAAEAGHPGHRTHIAARVPEFNPGQPPQIDLERTFDRLMAGEFWSSEVNRSRWSTPWNEAKNPNGDWVAFGHLFKVLYAFHRLIDQVHDVDQRRLCGLILLERYFNPQVQGG